MDPNQPFDYSGFGSAFAIIAAIAMAVTVVAGAFAGSPRSWLRSTWAFPPKAWNGFFIVIAFVAFQALTIAVGSVVAKAGWYDSDTLNGVAARLVVTPVFLLALSLLLWNTLEPFRTPNSRRIAGRIALGATAWFGIAALTISVHILTLAVKQELGGPVDQHPLAKLRPDQDRMGGVLFALSVCAMTPWFEEYIFRGLLLPWVMRGWYRPSLLVAWSFVVAYPFGMATWSDVNPGPLIFAVFGLSILGLCTRLPPTYPKRTILGIISTSLLFGAVHSSVWPSPIPLFVLGLGLGYLTARTGSIVPAVVVHGLFNAVSFVYLLRLPA